MSYPRLSHIMSALPPHWQGAIGVSDSHRQGAIGMSDSHR